jgi:ribosomal protein L4
LKRASQNLSGILKVKPARELNAYHVLRWPKILIEEEALPVIESRLLGEKVAEKEEVSRS